MKASNKSSMTAVERSRAKRPRKRFIKPIKRFDENGATQAFFDEQIRYPSCSEATDRVSGVSSTTTKSAMAKLTIAGMFPLNPLQELAGYADRLRLQLVVGVPCNARVYCEKTAQGKKYHRVKYDLPAKRGKRRQRSIYLGSDFDIAAWARDILTEKRYLAQWLAPKALDTERIQSLKKAHDALWKLAREIATSTNYHFHGYILRERHERRKEERG